MRVREQPVFLPGSKYLNFDKLFRQARCVIDEPPDVRNTSDYLCEKTALLAQQTAAARACVNAFSATLIFKH
jgi:hypothetical protein